MAGVQEGLVDTHAHLMADAFTEDRHEVIERARHAGVSAIVCVGDGVESSRAGIELAQEHEDIWATVGIHPHQAGGAPDDVAGVLKPLFAEDRVVAVGETGLDYHYDFAPVEKQQAVFRAHIRLACELGLPLVIHNRKADDDVLRILQEEGAERVGGVLHCFWSDAKAARTALDMGFYLGVGGPVTFRREDALRAVLADVPVERLLLETDSPYLAPVPYRGKRNEPAFVVESAKALAQVKGMSVEDIASVTARNASRVFGLA